MNVQTKTIPTDPELRSLTFFCKDYGSCKQLIVSDAEEPPRCPIHRREMSPIEVKGE